MQDSCSHPVTYVSFLLPPSHVRSHPFDSLDPPTYAQVYIVDLHSHHGTHLLRRDDIVPRPIVPDVPIALQDGDTLTFGKAVGKEPYLVSPVIANVMLIYDTETALSPPVSQPVISLLDSPTLPATPIKSKEHAESPNTPNAGRYGLFGPHSTPSSESSPSSSSEDFSQSDPDCEDDEDEEDDDYLDPPDEYPSVPFGGHAQAQSSTSACYASLPSLHGLGLLASRHVMHHAPPTQIPVHAPHTPFNMHSQMTPSIDLERRPFIHPWFDCSQRPAVVQDPANVTLDVAATAAVAAEEPMDISRPDSPPVTNLLHDIPGEVIQEALTAPAQTETHSHPIAEEPPVVGAYPNSPVRNDFIMPPWEVVDKFPQMGRQQQESVCQPQGQQLGSTSLSAEGTSPSSVIVEASESSEQLVEDVASDVDADGDVDIDPTPAAIGTNTGAPAPVEPGRLVAPAITAVPQPFNTHAPPAISAGAASSSSMSIDGRLTSLDEALVNLWVRVPLPISALFAVFIIYKNQGNVLRMQIAHRKTQTDHKMLSDRTDAVAARVDAVQADLRGAMRDDDKVEALRTRMQAAEDLFAELHGRLSAAEVALAEAKAQAEVQAQAVEQVVQAAQAQAQSQAQAQAQAQADVVDETEVSPCTHAPSALCAYSAQSVAAPASSTIAPITLPLTPTTRKRKRIEEDDGEVHDDVHEEEDGEQEGNSARACRPKRRKRSRRLARAAVQVTAAAVIGAVAAWSALAFV